MSPPLLASLRRRVSRIRPGRVVRRLTPEEIRLYGPVLDAALARKVWLVQLPLLPGPYSGLTVARLVVVERTLPPGKPSALLAHELVHVRQFGEKGLVRFTVAYNRAFAVGLIRERNWSKAYRAIPAEVEARMETVRWAGQAMRDRRDDEGQPTDFL